VVIVLCVKRLSVKIKYLKCSPISDIVDWKIGSFGSRLEILDQSGNEEITDVSVIQMVENCHNLCVSNLNDCVSIIMDLGNVYDIKDISINAIADRCPNLRTMDLYF
jgi:hypothetical protein